ncbi:MAG: hypothetical protein Q8Q52_05425 [Acidimicrobiia bacterium]|nr:hypothetical protein [Acidimicrobiia bacterium]
MRYRKKPVVIEAVQWTGKNLTDMEQFLGGAGANWYRPSGAALARGEIFIRTLEGEHTANAGDWIIKGVKGEFYPCKPDIFEMTYEKVEEP